MNGKGRSLDSMVWTGLALVIATIFLLFLIGKLRSGGLSSGHSSGENTFPVLGQVGDFTLTNQLGTPITLASLKDKVWVADIIFTRCAGPCLKMTRQMEEIQNSLPASSNAKLVSMTTDPDYDSPSMLKSYGARFQQNPDRWMFLTGSKQEIANLAIQSLKLTALEKKPEDRATDVDLFIHSTIFVVVDRQARLRAIVETSGDDIDPKKSKETILAAVKKLEAEP